MSTHTVFTVVHCI